MLFGNTRKAMTANGGGLAMPDIETSIRNNLPMAGSDQTYVGGLFANSWI